MSEQWPIVKIGDVVRQERDPVGSFDGDGLPVLGVTNTEGVTNTGVEASDDKSKYFRLRPGRFVYNPYRINVGSIGLSSSIQDGICSPAYVVFAPTERIVAAFLRFFLKSARGNQLINFHGNRGSVRSALRFDDLAQMEIPLPPLAEQRRVVARIEALAAQIHEARNLRHQATEEADALILSALTHLRLPSGTKSKSIAECSTMSTGTTPPSERSDFYGGPIQWYTPGDLEYQQQLGASSRTLSDLALAERKARMFESGTVLLVAIGGSLGKVALTHERCSANQQITGIKFSNEILPEFGFWWMRGLGKKLMASAPQATLPIINQERIGAFEISVPPLADQRRIVAELDALQAEVDALKRLQAETAAELDALLPAILDRAFKGEL